MNRGENPKGKKEIWESREHQQRYNHFSFVISTTFHSEIKEPEKSGSQMMSDEHIFEVKDISLHYLWSLTTSNPRNLFLLWIPGEFDEDQIIMK